MTAWRCGGGSGQQIQTPTLRERSVVLIHPLTPLCVFPHADSGQLFQSGTAALIHTNTPLGLRNPKNNGEIHPVLGLDAAARRPTFLPASNRCRRRWAARTLRRFPRIPGTRAPTSKVGKSLPLLPCRSFRPSPIEHLLTIFLSFYHLCYDLLDASIQLSPMEWPALLLSRVIQRLARLPAVQCTRRRLGLLPARGVTDVRPIARLMGRIYAWWRHRIPWRPLLHRSASPCDTIRTDSDDRQPSGQLVRPTTATFCRARQWRLLCDEAAKAQRLPWWVFCR